MAEAAVAFTEMIKADRDKKKREQLAQQMLGSRRSSGAGSLPTKRSLASGVGASLASRVGVTKQPPRSNSTTPKPSIDGNWTHDLHHVNNPHTARTPSGPSAARGNRLYTGLQRELSNGVPSQANVRKANGPSMSIRGMAAPIGPYVVIASNFAPGTTAADIEAAMQPIGGDIKSCRLVASNPTVMAELVFDDKDGADNVIATFNNQKACKAHVFSEYSTNLGEQADGRLLYVYMKQGGPTPGLHPLQNASRSTATPVANEPPVPPPVPEAPATYEAPAPVRNEGRDLMDVDSDRPAPDSRSRREARYGDRDRYRDGEYGNTYQNGSYGIKDSYDRRDPNRGYGRDRAPRGLYSDSIHQGDRRYRP